MEGAKEGSPRGLRPRHQSVQYGAPPTVPQRRQSREYDEGRIPGTSAEREVDDLSSLLASGHLGDFDFDSSMTAALAASLSIANEPSPPSVNRRLEQRLSAPPPQLNSARPLDSSRRPSEERLPDASVQAGSLEGSPGSARSRIYARRQERERQATLAGQTAQDVPVIPQRSTSTFSPPDSADSQHFSQRSTRDVRQTPPSKEKEAVARVRQSPNAAHHDIFKHFAPKDFSHLPPSPSSASINQFLRGSGSVNNFASASTPPGTTMATAPSYLSATSVSTAPSRTSLPASDSGGVRSMPSNQKTGWEGRSLGAETAETLRKLDGLGSTPGKAKPSSRGKSSAGSAHSRPGTPPAVRSRTPSEKKLFRKVSTGSAKAPESSTTNDTDGSPLHTWVDVADDTPGIPVPQQGRQGGSKGSLPSLDTPVLSTEKRESPSSTSFVGTPNSRDSHSVPPTSTRPSSLSDQKNEPRPVRRSSGDSDESVYSDAVQGDIMEKDAEASVPPVPPLPKRYMSMRQGLSNAAGPTPPSAYITLQESSLGSSPHGEVISPELSATSDTAHPVRPRPMNKKWSFSSALSLRLNNRDSSQSPAASQSAQPQDGCESPQTPWSEIQHGELSPPARLDLSESAPVRQDNRSIQSITPVATTLAVPKPSVANKRLTPSSMPFFRRASSSSVQSKTSQGSVPETPKAANPPPTSQRMPSGSQARRSVLGMHLPSMLRGSASKRGLSQPLDQAPALERVETKEQPASTGWSGHKRGKVSGICMV